MFVGAAGTYLSFGIALEFIYFLFVVTRKGDIGAPRGGIVCVWLPAHNLFIISAIWQRRNALCALM